MGNAFDWIVNFSVSINKMLQCTRNTSKLLISNEIVHFYALNATGKMHHLLFSEPIVHLTEKLFVCLWTFNCWLQLFCFLNRSFFIKLIKIDAFEKCIQSHWNWCLICCWCSQWLVSYLLFITMHNWFYYAQFCVCSLIIIHLFAYHNARCTHAVGCWLTTQIRKTTTPTTTRTKKKKHHLQTITKLSH